MGKRYLFFATLTYSYTILRPLQKEIWRRGDDVAWFLEDSCPDKLAENEKRLKTIEEVLEYSPIAVFAAGNYIYDFFPGVKVAVFHGYPINKRMQKHDDHFSIRGWFDIYCTQGKSSTLKFKELEAKHRFFKVYETGWCKVDDFYCETAQPVVRSSRPTILYGTTFTKGISSAAILLPQIEKLAATKEWDWIITFHPKLDDPQLISDYMAMAQKYKNVQIFRDIDGADTYRKADVLLCDTSSIIVEFMLMDKPVVTYRNTNPGNYLLDVQSVEEVAPAIEKALTRPKELMDNIYAYTSHHEGHRDGQNSARVLDAVDDFIANHKDGMKKKPLNLVRKLKMRWQVYKKTGKFYF